MIALTFGNYRISRRTVTALRWAIEERKPSHADERNTFLAPLRMAIGHLTLWGFGTALLTILYGLANSVFIPIVLFSVGFCGVGWPPVATFHRVRAAPGGRPGTRRGTTTTAVGAGHYGSNDGGVDARFGCARRRYRPDSNLRAAPPAKTSMPNWPR